jgi:hypothetical protein
MFYRSCCQKDDNEKGANNFTFWACKNWENNMMMVPTGMGMSLIAA